MTVQQRSAIELARRIVVLNDEVDKWIERSRSTTGDWGLHRSQIDAIAVMMEVLAARQKAAVSEVTAGLATDQFSEKYVDALRVICGVDELWRVFSHIFGQRLDSSWLERLRAADLTAAGCYRDGLAQPRAWGAIAEGDCREPPLVMLDADLSPAMVGRGGRVSLLGIPVGMFREQRLPVPVVTLPYDQIGCLWLATAIHHEVGHVLDLDLGLSIELGGILDTRMTDNQIPHERARFWGLWGGEILADAVGVLLGGAGYAITIASLSMVLAPRTPALNNQDEHPHSALRTPLVVAMLRHLNVPSLILRAAALEAEWRERGHPAWADAFVPDCTVVAQIYFDAPLTALGGRALREIVPALAADCANAETLSVYLRTGFNRPQPKSMPWRLVAVAAQLAVTDAGAADDATLETIDRRAREFMDAIPRPEWLAGDAQRTERWKAMAESISFSPPHAG